MTQFWVKPFFSFRDDLQAVVNARFTYWQLVMNALRLRAPRMLCLLVLLSSALSLSLPGMAAAAESGLGTAQDLRLVPFPKNVTLGTSRFSLAKSLSFEVSGSEGDVLARLLNVELQRAALRGVRVSGLKSTVPAFRLAASKRAPLLPALPQQSSTESYSLDIRADEIICAARDPAGLFYGCRRSAS